MNTNKTIQSKMGAFASWVERQVEKIAGFGKFERITAGVCMAIPFVLIIADNAARKDLWTLIFPLTILIAPQWVQRIINTKKEKMKGIPQETNHGLRITVGGGFLLLAYYLIFSFAIGWESKESISAYVNMRGPHIFGMVLAIAAMLFMASGVVFWAKRISFDEGFWRSPLNIVLGVLLLGVIIFPTDDAHIAHLVFAILFFVGCGVSTLIRDAGEEKKTQHQMVDFIPIGVIAFFVIIWVIQELNWVQGSPYDLINLFGAESVALWITGLDFILVSVKRELAKQKVP